MSTKLVLTKGDKVKVVYAAALYTFGTIANVSDDGQIVVRDNDTPCRLQIIGSYLYIELTEEPTHGN